ncbi:hypothetical protein SAMN05443545_107188 [Aidingimonas halophila]|uniref:Uncharacterized protein n=1 Tax=Aidingimonas halophila TaxID=574349 RepID=A0A1H3EPY5_9GAMM|nr:hypothetical protein SAMN05443545_107188 [Aidingimonas halophila]
MDDNECLFFKGIGLHETNGYLHVLSYSGCLPYNNPLSHAVTRSDMHGRVNRCQTYTSSGVRGQERMRFSVATLLHLAHDPDICRPANCNDSVIESTYQRVDPQQGPNQY